MIVRARKYQPPVVGAQWPTTLPCKIAIVGEAPGADEEHTGQPFVGGAGRLLDEMLRAAGIKRSECLVTNVFTTRPPNNVVTKYYISEAQLKKIRESDESVSPPPFFKGRGYLHPDHVPELQRLKEEIEKAQPNVVIALGATALWALTGQTLISQYRGTVIKSTLVPEVKVVPTYHPAAIMRTYSFKPVAGMDLRKARNESRTKELVLPSRDIWIRPTIADLYEFEREFMQNMEILAYDIETDVFEDKTTGRQPTNTITCIGFAPSPDVAIVVPFADFVDIDGNGGNYWASVEDEVEAVMWCKRHLESPVPKLAQNGIYDAQWLLRKLGIRVAGPFHDTMLMHHSIQPEMRKDLGTLGSMYTTDPAWKHMANFKANKKDA